MSNTAEYDNKIIYLDHAATTALDPQILGKMLKYFGPEYGNASSMYLSGRRSASIIATARKTVAEIICSRPDEVIFTGSGTESDNLALKGAARANRDYGNHIIISPIEHKAVIESAKQLEKEGFSISIAPVDNKGVIDISSCIDLITDKTILISIMYANNEIGTVQPIGELVDAINDWRSSHNNSQFPILHTDACQAAGALSLDVNKLGVDLMSLNGSKIYGPKGIGALYKRKEIKIVPIITGGEQEQSLRAGTESLPLIFGFAEALKKAEVLRNKENARLTELRDYFIKQLIDRVPSVIVNGHRVNRLPNNVHISIPYIEGESILLMLDRVGIEASTGSACSALDLRPSHVLTAIGLEPELAHGSIRFSLGRETKKNDLDYVLSVFPPIVSYLLSMSALTITKS